MKPQINADGRRFLKATNYELRITNYVFSSSSIRVYLRLFSLSVFLFLAQTISAQTISGVVVDSNKAPVSGAKISLNDKSRAISQTVTDAEGKFSFAQIAAQSLRIIVKANGFAEFSQTLTANFSETLNITLSPASARADVMISITQSETRLSETPASVVVLNRETLETTAAQNIDDQLRQIPGFNLFRRSSSKTTNPTAQGANLRGLSGSGAARSAVQLDGISVNDAFGGWTYWTRIPKSSVEQIETLRGGASAFYGDAALSGAVNLQTKSFAEKPILRGEISAGTQNTFDGSLFTAFGKNGWNASASVDAFGTRGYIPTAETERGTVDSNANSRYQNFYTTLEKRFDENTRIFGRGNYFAEDRDNGTILTTNQTRFRQIVFGADHTNDRFGAFQLRAFLENQTYDQIFSAISNNRNTETLSRFQQVPSQAAGAALFWTKVFGEHAVSASGEYRQVRGFSDEMGYVNNRPTSVSGAGGAERTFSAFVQDFWRVTRKLNVNFGARFDSWKNADALSVTRTLATNQTNATAFPDRNESAFSPRVAAIYQLNSNFALLGSYSKSFRAPTLNELYRAFRVGNVLTQANENLRAERADTYEAGLNFSGLSQKLSVRGNFFVTEIERPVVSITLSTAPALITRQRQNVGETRSRGIEIDTEYAPFRSLKFSAGYLLVDSRVSEFPANAVLIDKLLPQVARQQLSFQTVYRPTAKLSFSAQGRASDAQFEDDLNTLRLRPFFTLDALVSYKFRKFEIFTAVENLFNNRYDIGLTPNRNVAAPRFVRVGLRFNLGNK